MKSMRAIRRDLVKRNGKRIFKSIDRYFARQSLVPNEPVLDTALFPWTMEFERNWQGVRTEVMAMLQRREKLPFFQDISPDQMRISPDDKWRTFFLYGFGHRSEQNCRLCPQTASLLDKVPGIETAFFSILAPGKVIPSHCGVTKSLIRCHLGIVIPPNPDRCFMDVGDVRCTWEEGRMLLFDDTYPHSVSNATDQERVVLLFDFPRPLTLPGRLARRVMFWVFRRTAYVKDALRNEARWERRQTLSPYREARLPGRAVEQTPL
jgi:aspartyl/asparaginyl beta-hydroxylase (cupin superfamily)